MPMLAALIPAAFEAYAGVAAFAAGASGLAAVAAGFEIAGAAMTVVGDATGNQNLSTLGSIAGLAGGVGSDLVAGPDVMANTATYNPGADSAAADLNTTPFAPETANSDLAGSELAATNTGVAAGPIAAANPSLSGDPLNPSGTPITTGTPVVPGGLAAQANPNLANLTNGTGAGVSGDPLSQTGATAPATTTPPNPTAEATGTAQAPVGAPGNAAPTAAAPGQGGGNPMIQNAANASGQPGGTIQGQGVQPPANLGTAPTAPSAPSWMDQVTGWARNNPELTKVGGGIINGAMSYYGGQALAQSNLSRAQQYQDWVRQRYSDSVRNLTIPTIQASSAPSSGIIAGAKQQQTGG